MTTGISVANANAILQALFQQADFTAPTALWMQLHTGDPGAAGTANVATNTTRKECTAAFGTDPTTGSISNDAEIGPWDDVPANEDYTHATLWSLATGGTFELSGTITANAVTIGDSFSVPVGDFTSAFTPAA